MHALTPIAVALAYNLLLMQFYYICSVYMCTCARTPMHGSIQHACGACARRHSGTFTCLEEPPDVTRALTHTHMRYSSFHFSMHFSLKTGGEVDFPLARPS